MAVVEITTGAEGPPGTIVYAAGSPAAYALGAQIIDLMRTAPFAHEYKMGALIGVVISACDASQVRGIEPFIECLRAAEGRFTLLPPDTLQ